jgi:hypothetical protein
MSKALGTSKNTISEIIGQIPEEILKQNLNLNSIISKYVVWGMGL